MKRYIFLLTLITICQCAEAQFYFKQDTIHDWSIDTLFGSHGVVKELCFNGHMLRGLDDSIYNRIRVTTDSIGRVLGIDYTIENVSASMCFNHTNNLVTSSSVCYFDLNTAALSFQNYIPNYSWRIDSLYNNRRKSQIYDEGKLSVIQEEILLNNSWKRMKYTLFFSNGNISTQTILDEKGNGYHVEYDADGVIYRSCVYIGFEPINCQF